MQNRIEELDCMLKDVDQQVKILAHSKIDLIEKLADRLHDEYGDDLLDMDGVFAAGFKKTTSPESATGQRIALHIEPAIEKGLTVEEELDRKDEIRADIRDEFGNFGLDHMRVSVLFDSDKDEGSETEGDAE